MLKMIIDNEEVLSDNDISIKEEILSPSSTILNNVYPKSWELDKDYTSRFYYPKDYSKLNIQNFNIEPEEAGKTIQINGSATLTDVDTSKESRVLRILGQTSQNGTPTPSSPIPINVVSGDNTINICGKNLFDKDNMTKITGTIDNATRFTGGGSNYAIVISCLPNTTYCVQKRNDGDTNRFALASSETIPSSTQGTQTTLLNGIRNDSASSMAITTEATAKYLIVNYYRSSEATLTEQQIIDSIQIEKGSTSTTYEPYIGNTYPIHLGMKNLWNRTDVKDGFLPQSGSYPVTNSSYPNSKYIIVPLLTGQKLTLSGSTSSTGRVRCIDKDTNQVVNAFTATETEYYTTTHSFGDAFYNATITAKKDFLVGIMDYVSFNQYLIVNYGATPQYISDTPIELCKIGTNRTM